MPDIRRVTAASPCRSLREDGRAGLVGRTRSGGSGMDYISLAIMCEELERVDTAFRVVMSVHVGLNSLTLLQWGTEEQKQKLAGTAGEGGEARDLRPDRAERRLRCGRHRDDGRARMATITSSTARRCGFPWPTWPTTS